MITVCLIGDCHTAAMRYGWHLLRTEFPDIEITFFSSPRVYFEALTVRGNVLVPESEELRKMLQRSGLSEPVIEADYDFYVLCGMDLWAYNLLKGLLRFRTIDHATDLGPLLSKTCYARAVLEIFQRCCAMRVAAKVRAITVRPVTVVPVPNISDANGRPYFPSLSASGDAARIAQQFHRTANQLCDGIGVTFLEQPAETKSDPLQTFARYADNAPGEFRTRSREGDVQHMNAAYGAIVLRAVFAAHGIFGQVSTAKSTVGGETPPESC